MSVYQMHSQCLKKKKYSSMERAKKAAEKCKEMRNVDLRIYDCPYCFGYHLTHVNVHSFKPTAPQAYNVAIKDLNRALKAYKKRNRK